MPTNSQPNNEISKNPKATKGMPGMAEGNSANGEDLSNKAEVAARLSNAEGSMDDAAEDQEMANEGEDAFVDADVEADEDILDSEAEDSKNQTKH